MDPNANVRERIALWNQSTRSSADMARLNELLDAYLDWRAMGGYPAGAELNLALVDAQWNANLRSSRERRDAQNRP